MYIEKLKSVFFLLATPAGTSGYATILAVDIYHMIK